ncbi:MAG: chromate resistance protein ChrB domain-containing protein [Alphaproteobacteria bacterium]
MSAINAITPEKLARLIGTPHCPTIVQLPPAKEILIPGAQRRDTDTVRDWAGGLAGRNVVVVCKAGRHESAGVAAWLRQAGADAELLEGGLEAWRRAGLPVVDEAVLPLRDSEGRTLWVTRARPKVDRIACPWLIRRFVDPRALFLFVAPSEIEGVAERMGATPFDVDGVFWSHRGEQCSFDTMVEVFGLAGHAPLARLATIVRGADTARPELAPQSAGLLAVSLGLSRMYGDDLAQLEAGMLVYDALYRWCRDAVDETHDWVSHQPRSRARVEA